MVRQLFFETRNFHFYEKSQNVFLQANILENKPRLSILQFFKYGFAKQKIFLSFDIIEKVQALLKSTETEVDQKELS